MRLKKINTALVFILAAALAASLIPLLASAATYVPMEQIPGYTYPADLDFFMYVQALYNFGIAAIGIAALIMLGIGGFMYITSAGNASKMETAKEYIWDALIGLILALSAYLILFTINPDLVRLIRPGVAPVTTTGPAPVAPGIPGAPGGLPAGTLADAEARARLTAAGILITSSGDCTAQNNPSCTSLTGIPESTVNRLIQLRNSYGGTITVTGGTETGHLSHGTGLSAVDLSFTPQLAQYIHDNASGLGIRAVCTTPADAAYRVNCNYAETAQHLHVAFVT